MQVIILIIINAKLLYVAYFYGGPWSRIFGIRYQRLYVRKRGFVYKKGRLSDKCTAREVFPNLSTAEGRLQAGKTTSRIGAGDGLWTKCLRIVPDRVLIATLPLLLIIARLEE